ncbi:MAG: NUDIX hydrolase [Arcicella sp.]|nr:NUDIX hydrolase [Arcicella sp.]
MEDNLTDLTVHRQYGNRVRVRVCGVCIREDKILLLNHIGIRENSDFWCPPGGGLEFGETIEECLKREFLEETNTKISVGKFLTVNEFVNPPLHAIELFYEVKIISGEPKKGFDPEMEEQIITDLRWFSLEDILAKSVGIFHSVVLNCLSNPG